jgi:hypothetical protein
MNHAGSNIGTVRGVADAPKSNVTRNSSSFMQHRSVARRRLQKAIVPSPDSPVERPIEDVHDHELRSTTPQ